MGLPIAENDLFTASLIKLELERADGTGAVFQLMYEVEIRNRSTGVHAVLRARDLPPDIQGHLQELRAMLEQHAGERLFSTGT